MRADEMQSTLAYFKQFDYQLSLFEIKKWMLGGGTPSSLADIKKFLLTQGGGGAENTVAILKKNACLRVSELKRRRARLGAAFFSLLPYVRGVAVTNRVGWGTAEENSDIDFFIVTARGRIFLTRMIVAGASAILGLRVSPKNPGGFCLSMYASEDGLNLEKYMCAKDDVHFAYWLAQSIVIFDSKNIFEKFARENVWLRDFFSVDPRIFWKCSRVRAYRGCGVPARGVQLFFEILLMPFAPLLERAAKKIQDKMLSKKFAKENPRTKNAVTWNNFVIKLHWVDNREKYNSIWKQNLLA